MNILATCDGCGNRTEHEHWHDTAHGIAETHITGSERYVCKLCVHVTHYLAPGHEKFTFYYDANDRQKQPREIVHLPTGGVGTKVPSENYEPWPNSYNPNNTRNLG